jgi:hypothetical protein
VSLGDGGDKELQTWIRAHANFIEYVPLCLILIYTLSSYYGYRTVAGLSGCSCSPACCTPRACSVI